MAVSVPTLVTKGSDPTDTTAYATASINFVAGEDYFLAFSLGRGGATPDNPTVSGTTSGTWVSVNGITFNPAAAAQRSRVGIRRFRASSSFSEAINIVTTNTNDGAVWVVWKHTSVDAASPVVQSASNRGDAGTTATAALAAAMLSGGIFLGAFSSDTASAVFSAGGTCTLLDQASRTDVAHTLCVVYNTADEDPSATMAAADWGGAAFELRAAAAALSSLPLNFFTRDV